MKLFKLQTALLLVLALFIQISVSANAEGFNAKEYSVFVPEGLDENYVYPLILGFSASGNGQSVVNTWKQSAKDNNCIIIASNVVRNGMDIQKEIIKIKQDLNNDLYAMYPIDKDKVIAVGSSGGGMASHLFSFFHPDTIAAVISNVGYIHEKSLAQTKIYPRNKVCAFLAGTTDFNNKLMKEDYKFLKDHGWACKWIEFEGGHIMAPEEYRKEALEFVLDELNKKQNELNNNSGK